VNRRGCDAYHLDRKQASEASAGAGGTSRFPLRRKVVQSRDGYTAVYVRLTLSARSSCSLFTLGWHGLANRQRLEH